MTAQFLLPLRTPMSENILLIFAFAAITLIETLSPGPSMLLVIQARSSSDNRWQAFKIVLGILIANLAWVGCLLFALYSDSTSIQDFPVTVLIYFGMFYLVCLGTKRLCTSTSSLIFQCKGGSKQPNKNKNLINGVIGHAFNPLTISYYVSTLGIVAISTPKNVVVIFCAIAVLADLLVYSAIALTTLPKCLNAVIRSRYFSLGAGLVFFYLVSLLLGNLPGDESFTINMQWIQLTMLGGVLAGATASAHEQVISRRGMENKMLWRIARLWGVWFSIFAIMGAIYTVVNGDQAVLALDEQTDVRLKACFIIAAIFAFACSLAKGLGDVMDEGFPAKPPGNGQIKIQSLLFTFCYAAIGSIGCLMIIYGLLWLAGYPGIIDQVSAE